MPAWAHVSLLAIVLLLEGLLPASAASSSSDFPNEATLAVRLLNFSVPAPDPMHDFFKWLATNSSTDFCKVMRNSYLRLCKHDEGFVEQFCADFLEVCAWVRIFFCSAAGVVDNEYICHAQHKSMSKEHLGQCFGTQYLFRVIIVCIGACSHLSQCSLEGLLAKGAPHHPVLLPHPLMGPPPAGASSSCFAERQP